MSTTMHTAFVWVLVVALMGAWPATTAPAVSSRASFALLNEPGGDTSVQCRAAPNHPFTLHITMTNRGDLGGAAGFVRVTYRDEDFVDYAIPVNTTLQISLIGGGIAGVDDIITVSGDGPGRAVLVGQASLLTDLGGVAFCCTNPGCPPLS